MDFQIREPLHPLLGALKRTNFMMAVQAAQEYTGQQIHAVNLVTMWEEYLEFDTKHDGPWAGSKIKQILSNTSTPESAPGKHGAKGRRRISGMACVSNFGAYANWTGHVLAGSNSYGFGRLSWSGGRQTSEEINTEWAQLTFPPTAQQPRQTAALGRAELTPVDTAAATNHSKVVETVVNILQRSREVYEGYTSPLGIGFIVFGGGAYKPGAGGCAALIDGEWVPSAPGPGDGPDGEICPTSPGVSTDGAIDHTTYRRRLDLHGGLDHYWVDPCSNTGTSNYSYHGLGCDRTTGAWGTGYAGDYAPPNAAMFNNVETCPVNLLLWFHNLAWTHMMPKPLRFKPYLLSHSDAALASESNVTHGSGGNGTITLYELIRFTHFDSVEQAKALAAQWDELEGMIDEHRHKGVQARFAQQVQDATQMAHDIMVQYERWSKNI